jgi:arginyl-tRNA--protein-N-Asp/Glu arginylyltransferase
MTDYYRCVSCGHRYRITATIAKGHRRTGSRPRCRVCGSCMSAPISQTEWVQGKAQRDGLQQRMVG